MLAHKAVVGMDQHQTNVDYHLKISLAKESCTKIKKSSKQ